MKKGSGRGERAREIQREMLQFESEINHLRAQLVEMDARRDDVFQKLERSRQGRAEMVEALVALATPRQRTQGTP